MSETEIEKDVFHPEDLVDILPIYYNRLFPSEPFIKWLTQGKGKPFDARCCTHHACPRPTSHL